MRTSPIAAMIALLGAPLTLEAQWWLDVPTGSMPRTADGEVDLTAPAPKRADGHPDLTGIWSAVRTYSRDLGSQLVSGEIPYQPWARELAAARADGSQSVLDPPAACLPQGVPRLGGAPAPWKLVQTDDLIVLVYEAFNLWRQVFLDGRRLSTDVQPAWLGYSIGHWDDDTLVVETRGFNGKAWLDQVGNPSTEQLRTIERIRRIDYGHLEREVTIDDPGAYTRPWTVKQQFMLLPETELLEFICNENNQDLQHLPQ
jgi:hypothetical protein